MIESKIEYLLDRLQKIEAEKYRIKYSLEQAVLGFDGTLIEALEQGIVRLNFPLPSLTRKINQKRRADRARINREANEANGQATVVQTLERIAQTS